MRNKSEKIAIIDIGSNSVRLFIFSIENEKAEQVSAMKFFCGLGKALGTTGMLDPRAVIAAHEALQKFREEINRHAVSAELVIGTAALREAKDACDFIDAARIKSGFAIRIITGEEEARLAALAILSSHRHASGIVADFGGGSLELAKIGEGRVLTKISLRLGAHYLKAMDKTDELIELELRQVLKQYPEFDNPENLYIIGGSWRSLAKAYLHDNGENDLEIESHILNSDRILQFCRQIAVENPEALIFQYGMETPRAQLMDVSALMLEKIIDVLRPEQVKVSKAGIRDGLAYEYILSRRS